MRVLVTGAAGYIGSHTAAALRESGHYVIGLDRRESSTPTSDVELVRGEIADRALVESVIGDRGIDSVVHLAGDKSASESLAHPGRYFANNVCGTLGLLEAAAGAGVRRFVFSSSCAVYGVPERLPVTEESPVRPANPYGESKALAERLLGWYQRCHGVASASLRYFNAAGASLDGSMGEDWSDAVNLIPVVLKAAYEGRPVTIFGTDFDTPDGTAVRDYVHVVDLAVAHVAALDRMERDGQSIIVNLGTGRGWSVRDVVERAEAITGTRIAVRTAPRRPGDPAAIWADSSRAELLLDWSARYGIDEIIATAWRWHTRQARTDARGALLDAAGSAGS